jgi:hypothetical protein
MLEQAHESTSGAGMPQTIFAMSLHFSDVPHF